MVYRVFWGRSRPSKIIDEEGRGAAQPQSLIYSAKVCSQKQL